MRRLDRGERTWARSLREMQFEATSILCIFFKIGNNKYKMLRNLWLFSALDKQASTEHEHIAKHISKVSYMESGLASDISWKPNLWFNFTAFCFILYAVFRQRLQAKLMRSSLCWGFDHLSSGGISFGREWEQVAKDLSHLPSVVVLYCLMRLCFQDASQTMQYLLLLC